MSTASEVWAEGVQRLHVEAAGVLAVHVVQPADIPAILGFALAGDPQATRLATMLSQTLRGIQEAPRSRPMLCGSCPRPLRTGRFAIVLTMPDRDNPSQGMALAICERCGSTDAVIRQRATVALRRLWPNVRPITVTDPVGGHA